MQSNIKIMELLFIILIDINVLFGYKNVGLNNFTSSIYNYILAEYII